MARQRTFFHKCHRCIYRGQAANWEPAEAPMSMVNVHAAEEPIQAGVKAVKIPGKAAKKGSRPAATKSAAAEA